MRHVLSYHRVALLVTTAVILLAASAQAQPLVATGTFNGNSSAGHIVDGVGFRPDVVIVSSDANHPSWCRTSTMAPGYSKNIGENKVAELDRIVSLDDDGFTVGGDNEVNDAGTVYTWIALQADADLLTVGSYTGDGGSWRYISGLAGQPVATIVISEAGDETLFRTDLMAPWSSRYLRDSPPVTEGILDELADGFSVGPLANASGTSYHYLAWFDVPGATARGNYLGDGAAGKAVAGLGFTPEWVIIRGDDNQDGIHRPAPATGDASHYFTNKGAEPGLVQSIDADGFTVGARAEVNSAGSVYDWFALAEPLPTTDLQVTLDAASAVADEGDPVTFDITVTNVGTLDATGVQVTAPLPAGLTPSGATPSQGTHDPVTGVWDVGPVSAGAGATLQVVATVDAGSAGLSLEHEARLTDSVPVDANGTNDTAVAAITITAADIVMALAVSDSLAIAGAEVVFTAVATNAGPDDANDLLVDVTRDAGLLYGGAVASHGSYDDLAGVWTVGDLAAGTSATLTLTTGVTGADGDTLVAEAALAGLRQGDPVPANDRATSRVRLVGSLADLGVALEATPTAPDVGATVQHRLTLRNDGPDPSTGSVVSMPIPPGLAFAAATPSQGSYDESGGTWSVGVLPSGAQATLLVTTTVLPAAAGTTVTVTAGVVGDQADGNPANDAAQVGITVPPLVATPELFVIAGSGSPVTLWPGDSSRPVLTFKVINRGDVPDTLHSLALTNMTFGSGNPSREQLDDQWGPLSVASWIRHNAGATLDTTTPAVRFSAGRAVFNDCAWEILPGDTLEVSVAGAPTLAARDGEILNTGVLAAGDIVANQTVVYASPLPLTSGQSLQVDGFVADQLALLDVATDRLLGVGSRRNPILGLDLPSNGYLDDVLYGVNLINHGTAVAGSDIARMEFWSDDGNGVFDPSDVLLGELINSGDRWQLTGLAAPVPGGGHRFFVSVDIAESAQPARDIRLGLPLTHGPGVMMESGNDGPLDRAMATTSSIGISASDRVIVSADWLPTDTAPPGARGLPLLDLLLTNTYTRDQTLQSLVVHNATEASGAVSQAQRDSTIQRVSLRLDGNDDGVLGDLLTDPPLGTGSFFVDGRAGFGALDLLIPAAGAVRVFVVADLGLTTVAEGDRVAATVLAAEDVNIPGATRVAAWPLDSGAVWTVDGMVADQLTLTPVPLQSLGPDEGPALVMDLRIPGNGYLADELVGLAFADSGSAVPGDFARVQLWSDGGNEAWDAGLLDDALLTDLTWTGSVWSSPLLNLPVAADGRRLFASVDVATAPTDSATVRFAVPVGGISMTSGNSGPLDRTVLEPGTLVLTTSPLRSTLAFERNASTVGQGGRVVMTVRNDGSEALTGVSPGALTPTGAATISLGPPAPAVRDLAPGQQETFAWDFTAVTPGAIILTSYASGEGALSLDAFGSVPSPTAVHTVQTTPVQADLYPVVNLPSSVNKGQAGLVPLTFTLVNPGDATVADIELTSLRLRVTETDGGAVVVPDDLIERLVISEGTNVYAVLEDLPATADDILLPFATPARITSREPVSLGVRIDLKLNTDVPSFVLGVETADWLAARDTVDLADVPVVVVGGDFPIRTNQANLASPAGNLEVALVDGAPRVAVPGQLAVPLAGLRVTNRATETTASAINVSRVAFVLRDADGVAVTTPLAGIENLAVGTVFQQHFSGMPTVLADSMVVVDLVTPVIIAGGATVTLDLAADLAADAAPGRLVPVLGDIDLVTGLDANSGLPVSVTATAPFAGAPLIIVDETAQLAASGVGLLPATVADGKADLAAMDLRLVHGGSVGTADVTATGLTLTVVDAARRPLDPALVFERVRIAGDLGNHGDVVDPAATDGRLAIALSALTLAPGDTVDLQLALDLLPGGANSFECLLTSADLALESAVTGAPVTAVAAGGSWPLSSGLTHVVIPAEELAVGGTSLMPPLLAPRADAFAVLSLTLRNPATPGGGGIALHALTVDQPADGLDLGACVGELRLVVDDVVVATAADLDPAARSATLDLASPLIVAADSEHAARLELTVADAAPSGELALLVTADGLGVGPEGGAAGGIRVVPESGQVLPVTTAVGNVGRAGLEASYINFPNPFAAGREATTLAYSLTQPARVSLRILTPHGETVAVILKDESRAAGFYQQDQWQGLNGAGKVVRNGVYLAELVASYADGTRQRVLRKVAVVR